MPKLPVVSGKDTIRALEKIGFEVLQQKGSHVILKNVLNPGMLVVLYLCIRY